MICFPWLDLDLNRRRHATAPCPRESSASTIVTVIAASAALASECVRTFAARIALPAPHLARSARAGCSRCRRECCQRSRPQARDVDSDPTERESPAALSTMAATETRARVQPVPDDLAAAPSGSGTVVGVLGFGLAAGSGVFGGRYSASAGVLFCLDCLVVG